jgi:hypothetical protein
VGSLMERFIQLIKKKMLGDLDEADTLELDELLSNNPDYHTIFKTLFSVHPIEDPNELQQAHEAYAVHYVKMQLKELFKE